MNALDNALDELGWTTPTDTTEARQELAALRAERDEAVRLLEEQSDWFENAPFDFRNGIVAQGVDEGEYYGMTALKKMLTKCKTFLAKVKP